MWLAVAGMGLRANAQSWMGSSYDQLQHAGGTTGAGFTEPQDPRIIIANIIKVVLTLVATILFVLIIWAGFEWMTAGGNDEQVGKAKKTISNATIGLIVVLSSYAITIAVTNLALGRSLVNGAYQGTTLDNAINNSF